MAGAERNSVYQTFTPRLEDLGKHSVARGRDASLYLYCAEPPRDFGMALRTEATATRRNNLWNSDKNGSSKEGQGVMNVE